MQRRTLCAGTGVAAYPIECGDRDIQLVATGIFECQILGLDAAGIDGLQAEVAPDAVFLMHHRRIDLEVGQVADNGSRITCGATPACLAGPFTKQQVLGDDRQRGRIQHETAFQRRHTDCLRCVASNEFGPVRNPPGVNAKTA